MKLVDLLSRVKKDGIWKTIDNLSSSEEMVSEVISLKNTQLTNAKIAHKKLLSYQDNLLKTISKERNAQRHNEDLSIIDLKNDNKIKAFKLLKSALNHEKCAITLGGKLQKIKQNITDLEFDINTMLGELQELYDAQKYIVSHNKRKSPNEQSAPQFSEYKSPFVSISAQKIDSVIHSLELAFEHEHNSISEKLNYDDIESHLESIKIRIKG